MEGKIQFSQKRVDSITNGRSQCYRMWFNYRVREQRLHDNGTNAKCRDKSNDTKNNFNK